MRTSSATFFAVFSLRFCETEAGTGGMVSVCGMSQMAELCWETPFQ